MIRCPGTIQLATSPVSLTCIPPRKAISKCPPLMIAKEVELEKIEPPRLIVIVS